MFSSCFTLGFEYKYCVLCCQEEEEERSDRWNSFLERQAESAQLPVNGESKVEDNKSLRTEVSEQEIDASWEKGVVGDGDEEPGSNDSTESVSNKEEEPATKETKTHRIQIWTEIRPSLYAIENMMSIRVKKKSNASKDEQDIGTGKPLPSIEEARSPKGVFEEDSEDEFYDVERSDPIQDAPSSDSISSSAAGGASDGVPTESLFPWREELEVLVRGGVPMALRGEVRVTCLTHLCDMKFIFTE